MSISPLAALNVSNAIDAHIHPWRLHDLPPVIQGAKEVRPDLAQDFPPARIIDTAKESGFSSVIFVQARDPHEGNLGEAEFFISAANEHPQVAGCIVGINLLDTVGTESLVTSLGHNTVVRGCRMIAPENSGVGILSDPRTKSTAKLLGAHNLRLDLLIRSANPGQLQEAVSLVQWLNKNTETIVIGDHLLKPTGVAEGTPSQEWRDATFELARCENFYLKVSGLPGEVPPGSSFSSFWPFYDIAFEAFGASRLLFGSDYPVSYAHANSVAAVAEWLTARGLANTAAAQQIFSSTARTAYGIE